MPTSGRRRIDVRDGVYATAALTGLIGTGFHIFNISKKPGGFSWQNLFYSAPIGAPAALILSGMMGFLAERVRDTTPGIAPTIGGISAGRAVAAATSVGLLGTVGGGGTAAFPRRLPRSFHVPAGDDSAARGRADGQCRVGPQPTGRDR